MPVVNDTPKIIYVRDITQDEAEAFLAIKNEFSISSNSEAVKMLFLKFIQLQNELNEVKDDNVKLREDLAVFYLERKALGEAFSILRRYNSQK